MKTVYIDSEYKCHVKNSEGRRSIETEIFDNVCNNAIECYIFVPVGETYKGVVCTVGFIQCFNSKLADAYQRQYAEMLEEFGISYEEGVNTI